MTVTCRQTDICDVYVCFAYVEGKIMEIVSFYENITFPFYLET